MNRLDLIGSCDACGQMNHGEIQNTIDALTKERDEARADLFEARQALIREGMERDAARTALALALSEEHVALLVRERDDALAELAQVKADVALLRDVNDALQTCEHSHDAEACGECLTCARVGLDAALRSRGDLMVRAETAERAPANVIAEVRALATWYDGTELPVFAATFVRELRAIADRASGGKP